MVKDYQQLWKEVTNATDETQAVRTLAEIVADSAGRAFALNLEPEDTVLCIEALDYVSCHLFSAAFRRLRWFRQGIAEHDLKHAVRSTFFLTLR